MPQLDVVLALLLFLGLGLCTALEGRGKRGAPVQRSLCVRVQSPLPGVFVVVVKIHVGNLVSLEVFLFKVTLIHLAQWDQFSSTCCLVGEGIFTGRED